MVSSTRLNQNEQKSMSTEQFNQVVGAILDGKYSWACVLILRFAGYNPLHYVPYRTYNRLMKDNGQFHRSATKSRKKTTNSRSSKVSETQHRALIVDLNHCETISADNTSHLTGGHCFQYDALYYNAS